MSFLLPVGPNAAANNNPASSGRAFRTSQIVNGFRALTDFAQGKYIAFRTFFDELSRIQSELVNNDGVVRLGTGEEADIQTIGGGLSIQIYMEVLDTAKETMIGLSNLGLKNENTFWSKR